MNTTTIAAGAAKAQFLSDNIKPGENYAGLILGKKGKPDYHLVIVEITAIAADWQAQIAWAKKVGGELPTRRELNLLRTNLRELFASTLYWSSERYASDPVCVWSQDFEDGCQDGWYTDSKLRAVAVRRLPL